MAFLPTITLKLKLPTMTEFTTYLDVHMHSPDPSVEELKDLALEWVAVPGDRQRLNFNGTFLHDRTFLADYGITSGCVVCLEDLRMFRFRVKYHQEHFEFMVWEIWTIKDVKRKLSEKEGIPVEHIHLSVEGLFLRNHEPIVDYGEFSEEWSAIVMTQDFSLDH